MASFHRIGSVVTLLNCFMVMQSTSGAVTIFPSPRATVCHVGDRVEVTCNTTGSIVSWNLAVVGATNSISRAISTTTLIQNTVPINSTTLIFSRVSELRASPLISMLVITALNQDLNGTKITCKELGTTSMATTTVYIYGGGNAYQLNSPNVSFEEYFEAERVIIRLCWTQEPSYESLVSYSISVLPRENTMISMSDNTRANLTISYNTQYNVSVVANICGQRNSSVLIELNYVKCEDSFNQLLDDSLIVLGYSFPALEGKSINFSCSSGLQIIGANSSTCMGNGEWEPDISDFECKANCGPPSLPVDGYILSYSNTLEGAKMTYVVLCDRNESLLHERVAICSTSGHWEPNASNFCEDTSGSSINLKTQCSLNQDEKVAVASSVITAFTVASITFFTIGFLCGHFCRKAKKKIELIPQAEEKQTPYYDSIDQFDIKPKHLEKNIAYGQIITN